MASAGQGQELPGAVRLLVAPILLEHVQQIIEFAPLPPQLSVEIGQGRGLFRTTHPDAGQAIHHAVQVLIARQPGQEGGHDEEGGVVVTVFPEIHHEQIDGLVQVGRLRRMGVAAGQQGPAVQAQVGQGFQFLLGQGQGLGKIPDAEIGFHGRHPHRQVLGLFHAQTVQEFQGLGTPLQVSQDPGLLQTGDAVLRGLLQGEIIGFQGFRQVAQPQVEMGLLPEEAGGLPESGIFAIPGPPAPSAGPPGGD